MKYFLLSIIALLITGCYYNSILPEKTVKQIPLDANQVVLIFNMPKDSVYKLTTDLLLDQGYRIYNSDKQIAYISTDPKYIDNGMVMRLNIRISDNGKYTELSSKGEWDLDSPSSRKNPKWLSVKMQKGVFVQYTFEKMTLLLEKLPYVEIKFVKN